MWTLPEGGYQIDLICGIIENGFFLQTVTVDRKWMFRIVGKHLSTVKRSTS